MTELTIYQTIFWSLATLLAFYIVPKAAFHFQRLVKAVKNGETISEPSQNGVPTAHINVVDVAAVALLFCFFWMGLSQKASAEPVETRDFTLGVLLGNFIGQLMLIGLICVIWIFRVNLVEQFGLSLRGRWRTLWWSPAIFVACLVFTNIIIKLQYFEFVKGLNDGPVLQQAVQVLQECSDPAILTMLAMVACIGAPLSEEVLFRGYLFPVIKKYSSPWFAIIFSGAIFSLIHYNLAALPTLFLMGCLLALSYERTKSLWVPIIAHTLFNSATTIAQLLGKY